MAVQDCSFFQQLRQNLEPGPHFEREANLYLDQGSVPIRLLAFYLPQFHPIPENDQWWGRGFTEWTNVTKALPRFRGHYQPHLPADFGFYDLRIPAVLDEQARVARRFGISAFCFHHYWFRGRRLLRTPLDNLLAAPEIDIDFCVNWANESWSKRWDGSEHEILISQSHTPEDDISFARSLEPLFADRRYVAIGDRPLLIVYRPSVLPDARATVDRWRNHFSRCSLKNPFIVMVQGFGDCDPKKYGFDAAVGFPPLNSKWIRLVNEIHCFDPDFTGFVGDYSALAQSHLDSLSNEWTVFPGVCPNWDNEARRPGRGVTFVGSNPELYGRWLESASRTTIQANRSQERLVFINAWNEWAEGAHLEPDRHFGYAYLNETKRVLSRLSNTFAMPPQGDCSKGGRAAT